MITLAYLAHTNQQAVICPGRDSSKRSSPSLTRPYLPSDSSWSSTETATISVNSRKSIGLTLAELIFDGHWEDATAHVIANGRDARRKLVAPKFMNRTYDSELLPIHYALSKADVTIRFLEALVFAYPQSLEKKEMTYKRTCLHIALRSLVPDEVVSFLIAKNPHAASMRDSMGRVPLHYALSNMRSPKIVKELCECSPDTLLAQDADGWSPLHVALGNNSSFEVVKMLITMAPESVLQRSFDRKRTPLGLALQSKCVERERIIRFIEVAMQTYLNTSLFQNFMKAEKKRKSIRQSMGDAYYV